LLRVAARERGAAEEQRVHQAAEAPDVCGSGAAAADTRVEQQLWRDVIGGAAYSEPSRVTVVIIVRAASATSYSSSSSSILHLPDFLGESEIAEFNCRQGGAT
jgi:hypothetical protein